MTRILCFLVALLLTGCMNLEVEIKVPPEVDSDPQRRAIDKGILDSTGIVFAGTVGDMYPVVTVNATSLLVGPVGFPPYTHVAKVWGKVVGNCSDNVPETQSNEIHSKTLSNSNTPLPFWKIVVSADDVHVDTGEIYKVKAKIWANGRAKVWEMTACETNSSR